MAPLKLPRWTIFAVLTAAFALSHAFRTVVTLVATPLHLELALGSEAIGLIGGAFHVAFGAMQLPMGVALDLYGPRRVFVLVFPAAAVGALLVAVSSGAQGLLVGQLLIGLGCAPVFLATMVMIGRHCPPERFSGLTGIVLGLGGAGMLITGTPLAWVVATWSWRAAYVVLALASLAAWTFALVLLPAEPPETHRQRTAFIEALVQVKAILARKQTWGLVALGAVTYASFISLRGLWLVPLLADRHGYALMSSGHVALAGSVAALVGPPLFGRIDPGGRSRRQLIVACTLLYALLFALLAIGMPAIVDVALTVTAGALAGYFVLQYADVRSAYPSNMSGRALAIFNTSMFLGVAAMQWASGIAASAAGAQHAAPVSAAFWIIATLLVAGTAAFALLPWPTGTQRKFFQE